MVSLFNVALCAAVALLVWTCVGLAVAPRLGGERPLPWQAAPALGWAIHSAVALPALLLIGFSAATVASVSVVLLVLSLALVFCGTPRPGLTDLRAMKVTALACIAAALLALVPALAVVPKTVAGGVALAGPIFDHSKVAIIDGIARLGLPPANPFFGAPGEASRLAYYYLWHFSAAELARVLGVSGWEADIALTWFTAFASLMLMIALAVWLSGRAGAALWVVALAAAASLRPLLGFFLDQARLDSLIMPATGFGGWLFQAAWVPQHLASASCVVLAFVVLAQMARRPGFSLTAVLALVVAAGFGSSTWVGGVTFALGAAAAGVVLLITSPSVRRVPFLLHAVLAAVLAVVLCAPLLHDQVVATALRGGGSPIAFHHYEVLGDVFPQGLRRLLDLPGYWLVFLVIELPATYVTGALALVWMLRKAKLEPEPRAVLVSLALLTVVSLATAWLLISTIGENNDLGWRAVLPAVLMLIVFSAAGLSQWLAAPATRPVLAALALGGIALGLPESAQLLYANAAGHAAPSKAVFAASAQMWDAVRRHAAPGERVGNNPLFLADMTPWPVNISWALLADRSSCFPGRELTLAYVPLPAARREAINAQFIRVFDGTGSPADVADLASRYGCRVIVLTRQDGAWARDPFADSAFYHLVDERPGEWRIYRAL